jgi:PAS domain-containing protein
MKRNIFNFFINKKSKTDIVQESLLFSAVQKSFDGIALLNFNQTILYANDRFWAIYGIPLAEREKYMSQKWDILYSEQGQKIIQENIYPALDANSYWAGAAWVKSCKGRKFFADLSIIKYDTGYLGLVRDRTDFVQEIEKNKLLTRELHGAQKDNAIMAAVRSMIHDFNNTLSVIKGHTELLEDGCNYSFEQRQSLDYIKRAVNSSQHMLARVRSLIPQTMRHE